MDGGSGTEGVPPATKLSLGRGGAKVREGRSAAVTTRRSGVFGLGAEACGAIRFPCRDIRGGTRAGGADRNRFRRRTGDYGLRRSPDGSYGLSRIARLGKQLKAKINVAVPRPVHHTAFTQLLRIEFEPLLLFFLPVFDPEDGVAGAMRQLMVPGKPQAVSDAGYIQGQRRRVLAGRRVGRPHPNTKEKGRGQGHDTNGYRPDRPPRLPGFFPRRRRWSGPNRPNRLLGFHGGSHRGFASSRDGHHPLHTKLRVRSVGKHLPLFADDETTNCGTALTGFDQQENVRRFSEISGKQEGIFLSDGKVPSRVASVETYNRAVAGHRLSGRKFSPPAGCDRLGRADMAGPAACSDSTGSKSSTSTITGWAASLLVPIRSPPVSRPRLGRALNPSRTAIPRRPATSGLSRTDTGLPGDSQTSQPSLTVGATPVPSMVGSSPYICISVDIDPDFPSLYGGSLAIHQVICPAPGRSVTTSTITTCRALIAAGTLPCLQGNQLGRQAAGLVYCG